MNTKCEYEILSVDEVELDKDNPRIKKFLAMYGDDPTPDQIFLALGAGSESSSGDTGTSFLSLRESIRTNGGIIQPIVVNKLENGKQIVIEGNTRVAIYSEFKNDGVVGDWSMIPAIVYRELEQDRIDAIRLQAHLVGPRAWDAYSKAQYLHFLHTNANMPFDRLVDYCGGKRKDVERYIAAYSVMEEHYRAVIESDGDFDHTRFSGFIELHKGNVKAELFRHKYTLKDFSQWIHDGLLEPLNMVRKLPKILKNQNARKIFLERGAKEAEKVLDGGKGLENLEDIPIKELCDALRLKIELISLNEAEKLKSNSESTATQSFLDLSDSLKTLLDYIKEE